MENRSEKMLEVEKKLKDMLTQWRVCERLVPRVTESNFIVCLKKMFNKNYVPKTEDWWRNRCVIDTRGIEALTRSMLRDQEIDFIDVFTRFKNGPTYLEIYIVFDDHKYSYFYVKF